MKRITFYRSHTPAARGVVRGVYVLEWNGRMVVVTRFGWRRWSVTIRNRSI